MVEARSRRTAVLNNLKIENNKIFTLLHDEIFKSMDDDSSNTKKQRHLRERKSTPDYNVINNFRSTQARDDSSEPENARLSRPRSPRAQSLKSSPLKSLIVTLKMDPTRLARVFSASKEELPYRGILTYEEGNTFNTRPTAETYEMFQAALRDSKQMKKEYGDDTLVKPLDEEELRKEAISQSYAPLAKLRCIHFGDKEIDTWYNSPYPEEYTSKYVLHICEHCLKYTDSSFVLDRHLLKCAYKYMPPGNEIYRDRCVSVFEVDGRKNTIYCQNLCLLAKLFLNSKTLYYDVEPFMFYVLYEIKPASEHYSFVGYFSKEKLNSTNYNVSCILTLPTHQRKGYGNFLIEFSYLLTRREYKLGTPEKPLSELGLLSYRNYWKHTVCRSIKWIIDNVSPEMLPFLTVSISDICDISGMVANDVVTALEQLEMLVKQHDQKYGILVDMEVIEEVLSNWDSKNYLKIQPENLIWKSVVLGPSGGINTTSTMVVAAPDSNNPNGNNSESKSANSISIITNFMTDDLEDERDVEEQALSAILERVQSNKETYSGNTSELEDVSWEVMHPATTENNQSIVYKPIGRPSKVVAPIDEEELGIIFNDSDNNSNEEESEDDDYNEDLIDEEEEDEEEEDSENIDEAIIIEEEEKEEEGVEKASPLRKAENADNTRHDTYRRTISTAKKRHSKLKPVTRPPFRRTRSSRLNN
ncbi:Histone acetyltransferase [Komagataella phaffii CBS 7435]|uniref:Histone acetyltransferase n=2 Tax=Komagataella phaffii TaxID=460519 RepID=C4R2I0_KOMPG|nr:Histone acetyltransferase catalytic subunit of NuA3 complex that acetylates histone H3, involved in [Komagataella phaffii GS115]AOA62036.1 GQ67_01123T0 [Komagataella phaffii]CAH2447742.1 Histone acetyltransferase [Komagataella phaffii CBS 7435]AOA68142.1 GQ68_00266T0 [Komagataella phaffii GS115]CAY69704.1 Histone acetyltransferase catalytic subunit of NuA3 complex that acetylates histone H3, involved in [Komagataella phaffii GS115]CCA37920.1 Histone acetyltransferase [Komagataella phaffii C